MTQAGNGQVGSGWTARRAVSALGGAVLGLALLWPATAGAQQTAPPQPIPGQFAFNNAMDGDEEIYLANPDGAVVQQLTTNTDAFDAGADFSPDGQRISL